ncbi:TrmH family RNA methyltransferase [Snodgrassella gandavensis]|uniref:TrmH family RNA methyltransferase n=1 Tax=Snodgrassella gandavensis TaxID=2946698 RepID=UPI001EF3F4CE|nr:RNA methyltransferase [Snodgrassella gandavensis]
MKHKIIQSASNSELKHLARLIAQSNYRRQHQLAVLEGIHLIQTFIQAEHSIQTLYVPQLREHDHEIAALIAKMPLQKVVLVADNLLDKISDLVSSREPVAIVQLPENIPATEIQDAVLLERVQDPGNVGTILRSALAAGIDNIVLSKDSVDVWSPKVLRAAMGAHAYLNIQTVTDLAAWCADYTWPLYATALSTSAKNLYTLNLTQPAGWLFGNEGSGLSAKILQTASRHVIIPMSGQTESLNVAMAATVCLFEQQRQRQQAGY